MNKALRESLKEFGRVTLFAIISYGVSFGLEWLAKIPQTEATIIGTIILRQADKFLHEWGKETDNAALVKGLSRF